ncbi:uncharacterized protein Bfra_010971 [Botrytis fragariae]|uniref:2EXR domain-containing protein n=1 Tax=Botrytis fragariae TaxID=1964551 RepID=A0A8H6ALG5_9HELO|nr:uncharacterized protein Bfra_010971 [Botrytis fragariae]KAF5869771.1 hypothetical protein Bfra_010971 [Botrytis fragariae]
MASTSLCTHAMEGMDNMNIDGSGIDGVGEDVNATNTVEMDNDISMGMDQSAYAEGAESAMASANINYAHNIAQLSSQPGTFHRSSDFPAEVRCTIWKYHAEDEEDFGEPHSLTIIAKYTGENPKKNSRCNYVTELLHHMELTDDQNTRSFQKSVKFPWTAQPAPSYKIPASLYVNKEGQYAGQELYSKSHFLMSILETEKPVYFREDLDTLHFSDWFTFNTFCVQFAFVQTDQTSIRLAMEANRRVIIPEDEVDISLHLRCVVCRHNNRGWHRPNPCVKCLDMNPRQRLDDYIKNVAIGTESFGLPEKINAEKFAVKQTQRMQKLRIKALQYMDWGFNKLDSLVLGMDSHLVSDTLHQKRPKWVEDRWKFKEDIMRHLTYKAFEEVEFLSKKEFIERFGERDPRIELGW